MKFRIGALVFLIFVFRLDAVFAEAQALRIGLISPLTGPLAPLASSEGTILAIEEANSKGGIGGRRIDLIVEDGKCEGAAAAAAVHKLIDVHGVKFILGGQCSVETLAIAPIVQRAKVVTIASTSSSPDISQAGSFVFRTSPNSLKQGELLAQFAARQGYSRVLSLTEESPYAAPITAEFTRVFSASGGRVIRNVTFNKETSDFRSLLSSGRALKPSAIIIVAQSVPLAAQVVRQMKDLRIDVPVLSGETIGNVPTAWPQYSDLFEGITFSQPGFDLAGPRALAMIERYKQRFGGSGLKYPYQAEAYDAATILLRTIERCGDDAEKVQSCLSKMKDFPGASGNITFDENGDAVWPYVMKRISSGKVVDVRS